MAYDVRWQRLLKVAANQWAIWLGTLVLRDEIFRATFRYSLQGVALFLIFAGVLFAERGGIVRWVLNLPVMVWLGVIDISVYLWHMAGLADRQTGQRPGGAGDALIAAAATFHRAAFYAASCG